MKHRERRGLLDLRLRGRQNGSASQELATKPEDPSSTHSPHAVEGEN